MLNKTKITKENLKNEIKSNMIFYETIYFIHVSFACYLGASSWPFIDSGNTYISV